MTNYVRVKDPGTGHEFTLRADGRIPEGVEILDKPALGRDGLPRPPKYRVPLGEQRAASSQMDDPTPVTKKAAEAAPTKTAAAAANKEK